MKKVKSNSFEFTWKRTDIYLPLEAVVMHISRSEVKGF